jgi:hypothetical protein
MADDLADLDKDHQLHPQRGLVKGDIDPIAIKKAIILATLLLLALNLRWPQLMYLMLIIAWYWLVYRVRSYFPKYLYPWAINLIFFAIPPFAAGWSAISIWMALFIGLAVVAHDISHSIGSTHMERETTFSHTNPSYARHTALTGAMVNLIACLSGIVLWIAMDRPILFIYVLAGTTVWLFFLHIRLIIRPCADNAKAFYVSGFLFFLLPLTASILGSVRQ